MNGVSSIVQIDLLVYSIVLDVIMYYYLNRNGNRKNYSEVLFKCILVSAIFIATAETISWSVREVGNTSQIPIRYWSNAVFLSSVGLPAALGLSYLDYKIFGDIIKSKKRLLIYLIPTYINIGFVIYNHFSRGFLFTVDSTNRYYRGIGVSISNVIMYVFVIGVILYFYRYKNLIIGRVAQSITIFVFVPIIGSILQTFEYGTTFGMPSYTLTAFLIFLIAEKDEMARDPLTKIYTRANMENRLRYKLKSSEPFTVIIIDLNDFKNINDTYGHLEGDRVLQKVSEILTNSINVEDMVCRYGGDEFFLLIENQRDIGAIFIDELEQSFRKYNERKLHPYQIKLSYGYEFVHNVGNVKLEELISCVDKKMYQDKIRKRKSS